MRPAAIKATVKSASDEIIQEVLKTVRATVAKVFAEEVSKEEKSKIREIFVKPSGKDKYEPARYENRAFPPKFEEDEEPSEEENKPIIRTESEHGDDDDNHNLEDLRRRRREQVKANSAIDDEIRRIEKNAKRIVSGDIESIVKDKKREEAAKDAKEREANAKQEESVKVNRHRLEGMLTETDQLIAKRETETGVTTAQHVMQNSGDKILQKLRDSRTKIYDQIVKINEEYPEISFVKAEAPGAAPAAEKP